MSGTELTRLVTTTGGSSNLQWRPKRRGGGDSLGVALSVALHLQGHMIKAIGVRLGYVSRENLRRRSKPLHGEHDLLQHVANVGPCPTLKS